MRQELRSGHTGPFSRALITLLRDTLAAGEQTILFLNRRGLATFVQCRACGNVSSCPRCDIPYVYHADREILICHRCNGRENRPRQCGACGSTEINYFGAGTQRIEREVRALLPKARVLRWDQDAISAKVDASHLLARVQAHEVDIVVGTQMVAKGLDLPLVTGIGVINADTLLNLPDFRAGERTFQLLTQVAGRAGRRGPGGRVDHPELHPRALRHRGLAATTTTPTSTARSWTSAAATATRRSADSCASSTATPTRRSASARATNSRGRSR